MSLTLAACGPKAPNLSILPASQSTYQNSVSNNKVDILWVIDNSGSMAPKQTKLANGFSSFISVFNTKGFDYQMAVVTTDARAAPAGQEGLFQGTVKILTDTTPNLSAEFSTNVAVGTFGNPNATALDSSVLALSDSLLGGANTGFIRPEAHLAVIYVSDADDNDSTTTTAATLARLEALKPDRFDVITRTYKNNYTVSAVVVEDIADLNCVAPFEKGTKFLSLATSTSGSVANICDADFSSGLTTLSQKIAEAITEIPLARTPDVSTMSIYFNGSLVPQNATDGWTYVSSGNKIVFHGNYIPQANTSISINYIPSDIIR